MQTGSPDRCIKDLNGKIIIGMIPASTPAAQRCNKIVIIECDHPHAVKNGLAKIATNEHEYTRIFIDQADLI